MRRTKIVATVGPASDSIEVLSALIEAGVNVFRLNFSHGTADEQSQRAYRIRELAAERGCHVALLGDLQGPKIRLRKLPGDAIDLKKGQTLILDAALKDGEGNEGHVGVDYQPLAERVSAGDVLLLDDGRFRLVVEAVSGSQVRTVSHSAGVLKSRKGINRMGGGLSAPALTAKDLEDVKTVAALALDYVAISFPSGAADIEYARSELDKAGCIASVIGKVERAEAVADDETLDGLIEACDGIMVARGDLGVEIGDANLIAYQKHMIKRARQLNRVVITATQMMESMISNPLPTRAEVFDVANAVLDGTDAVMLSAE
ncbi:MAG: pyruvate kinase, partial [Paracoccaceae bacterium]